MFDYEKMGHDLLQQMKGMLDEWTREHKDIYIFSLDCDSGMESIGVIANTVHYLLEQTEPDAEEYWYYKYCEEEWELFHTFQDISAKMMQYLEENNGVFSDLETSMYTQAFDAHYEKMIQCCTNTLIRLRESLGAKYSDILFTLNLREAFEAEERIEIFEKINRKSATQEYRQHIEEFA